MGDDEQEAQTSQGDEGAGQSSGSDAGGDLDRVDDITHDIREDDQSGQERR